MANTLYVKPQPSRVIGVSTTILTPFFVKVASGAGPQGIQGIPGSGGSGGNSFLTISRTEQTSTVVYYGGLDSSGNWKINKWLISNLTAATSATVSNNSGTTTLNTAWTNRATLVYS